MPIYDSVSGVARKVVKMYDEVDGVAREIVKTYDSVEGVARLCFLGNKRWSKFTCTDESGWDYVPYSTGDPYTTTISFLIGADSADVYYNSFSFSLKKGFSGDGAPFNVRLSDKATKDSVAQTLTGLCIVISTLLVKQIASVESVTLTSNGTVFEVKAKVKNHITSFTFRPFNKDEPCGYIFIPRGELPTEEGSSYIEGSIELGYCVIETGTGDSSKYYYYELEE